MNFILAAFCFLLLVLLSMATKPKFLALALIPAKVILALATGAFAANIWFSQWAVGLLAQAVQWIGSIADAGFSVTVLAGAILFLLTVLVVIHLFVLRTYTSLTEIALIASGFLLLVASAPVATAVGRISTGAESIAMQTVGSWIGA